MACVITRQIRSNADWAHLPIVAMTAHAMAQDAARCLALGMNDHVTKPFEPEHLFAVVAKWGRQQAKYGAVSGTSHWHNPHLVP